MEKEYIFVLGNPEDTVKYLESIGNNGFNWSTYDDDDDDYDTYCISIYFNADNEKLYVENISEGYFNEWQDDEDVVKMGLEEFKKFIKFMTNGNT